ncbi:hypothetical protein FHW58_004045 [Duganella sp. 1224]|uniref:hypothetical protein n=1 Tax=Duganella sp. 1224 TaxID=2587052 RepID=UPI0015CD152C|nr:hypothetical protein [Duganella sp. 1224]NYE62823.1 hypothetical protein [Duganella sp. 1224]
MSRFFIYAVIVVLFSAGSSWTRMAGGGASRGYGYGGSAWSSHTGGGGGSWGGGSGGGGHK